MNSPLQKLEKGLDFNRQLTTNNRKPLPIGQHPHKKREATPTGDLPASTLYIMAGHPVRVLINLFFNNLYSITYPLFTVNI